MSTTGKIATPEHGTAKEGQVFTRKNRAGLVIASLLAATDVPAVLQPTPEGEVGPPLAVLALSTLCGLVTLVSVGYGWLRRSWPVIRLAAGARIVAMLLAMPAFFVEGLPGPLRATAALYVLVTIGAVVLMLLPARSARIAGGPR